MSLRLVSAQASLLIATTAAGLILVAACGDGRSAPASPVDPSPTSTAPSTSLPDGGTAGVDGSVERPGMEAVDEWTREFGSDKSDEVSGVAVDAKGNVVIVGTTGGALPGQQSKGSDDVFAQKLDARGTALWTVQFGTAQSESSAAVAVDGEGSVFMAGTAVSGAFPGQPYVGSDDAFVQKLDAEGNLLWFVQVGTSFSDAAHGIAVDSDGNVIVVGETNGTFRGQTFAGGVDAFVQKLSPKGDVLWTRQFGSKKIDVANAVAIDAKGNVLVAGYTLGDLPGEKSSGGDDAFVVKLDADGNVLWTDQFGIDGMERGQGVAVDDEGNALVTGYTVSANPLVDPTKGARAAFLRKVSPEGTVGWTKVFGRGIGGDSTVGAAVAVAPSGRIVVVGSTTVDFSKQYRPIRTDIFAQEFDLNGEAGWVREVGSDELDEATSMATAPNGDVLVGGSAEAAFPGQTYAGGTADAVVLRLKSDGNPTASADRDQ